MTREDVCTQIHRTQVLPSGVIIAASAVVPPALITLLAPVSGGIRTAPNAVGMVAGLVVGIVLVSQRGRRTGAPLIVSRQTSTTSSRATVVAMRS